MTTLKCKINIINKQPLRLKEHVFSIMAIFTTLYTLKRLWHSKVRIYLQNLERHLGACAGRWVPLLLQFSYNFVQIKISMQRLLSLL